MEKKSIHILKAISKLFLSIALIVGLSALYHHFTDLSIGWCILLGFFTPFITLVPFLGILLIIRTRRYRK